jgi:hypothetical protein
VKRVEPLVGGDGVRVEGRDALVPRGARDLILPKETLAQLEVLADPALPLPRSWVTRDTRDGVRIMHYDPDKKEYTAFHSNVNFELESWEGRTPKEALSRLIAAHKNTIKWLKGQREALDERIPKEEEKLKQMLAWIKRAK